MHWIIRHKSDSKRSKYPDYSALAGIALVMSVGVLAHADPTYSSYPYPTQPIKIGVVNEASGYSYAAYQLFKGELSIANTGGENGTNNYSLANIDWGSSIDGTAEDVLTALATNAPSELNAIKNAAQAALDDPNHGHENWSRHAATTIASLITDTATAKAYAAFLVNKNLLSNPAATTNAQEIINFNPDTNISGHVNYGGQKGYILDVTNAGYGYYLVIDSPLNDITDYYDTDSYNFNTDFIMQVIGSVQVKVKGSVPTVEKKVKELNDSDPKNGESIATNLGIVNPTGWQDAADFDWHDEIEYRLLGTLPNNIDDYKTYYYEFYDKFMSSIQYVNESTAVIVYPTRADADAGKSGVDITALASITCNVYTEDGPSAEYNGAKILRVIIDNLKAENMPNVTKDSVVVVTYKAKLEQQGGGIVPSSGDPIKNIVRLIYSNNPNGNQKGETPWDEVGVFTYSLVINKVKEDGTTPLPGADFKLYKYIANHASEDEDAKWVEVTGNTWNNNPNYTLTQWKFVDLDAGKYKLVETRTPLGYNTIDDIIFYIKGIYNAVSEDGSTAPELTDVIVYKGTVAPQYLNGYTTPEEDTRFDYGELQTDDPIVGKYAITTNIVNQTGTVLPSTGGIGTTIFYVVGSILVVAAGVLLVTKKRMGRE